LKVVVASAHRYPDLARLWFRSVARDLLPALKGAGAEAEVLLFRDATPEAFDARHFPGATLLAPSTSTPDFIAFYDAALERPGDILFLLDADVFVLDGHWVASLLGHFEDPTVAAVSLLRRTEQPGVFALLARCEAYRALPAPVLAPSYEGLERWPRAVNHQPGDRAAMALRARGKKIVEVSPAAAASRLADFHGTTVVRASREIFGGLLGLRFDALFAEKPYFAMGAYDNLLLGSLFRAVFGAPFAAAPGGAHLSGSATPEDLRDALATIRDRTLFARLVAYFERSDRALVRLASREGLTPDALHVPRVLPRARILEAHAWAAARRLFGRGA
jgi:hypothetical protein